MVGNRHNVARNTCPAGGKLSDGTDIEVAKDCHGHCAGNWRGSEHNRVRSPLRLLTERLALLNAKSVLLVDNNKPKILELHGIAHEGVRANNQLGGT